MARIKKLNGRPTAFNQTLAATICRQIAEGNSLRSICAGPRMPSIATVFRWIAEGKREGFRDMYEASVKIRLETLGDELIELADAPVERNASGTVDSAAVQNRRLQIETRRWILSKLLPRKYGDRAGFDSPDFGSLVVVTGVPQSDAITEQTSGNGGF